jgi:acetate---CoA ligase (ADP-forming)
MPAGTEILMGMTADPKFGPVVTVGIGGIFVEVMRDFVCALPPFGPAAAIRYLERLKGFPLLTGVRGRPKADLGKVAQAMSRFSVLTAMLGPELEAIEANPVVVGAGSALAVDALVLPKPLRHLGGGDP